MNSSDFSLKIIAELNKQLSKKQIKSGLKTMDNSMYVKVISKLTKALSQRQLKKDLKQLNDLYVQIGTKVKVDKNTKNQLQKRIKELTNSISAIDVNLKVSKSKVNSEVASVRKAVQAKTSKDPIGFDIEVKRSKAIADIEYLGKRFSKLFTNVSAKQKYENILMSAYSISDDTQLKSVRNQIAAFTSELKANDLASQSLGDKWKGLIAKSKELFSAASIVTAIFSQVKQSVSTFLQLDTAMTNLYKVQDQITSRDQFSGLLSKWNKLAQNLAVTTESLINSAAEWSKIGFDLDMSEQLAQITSIFEKTAEISNEKASSTLISAAQAFTEIDDLGVDDYVERVEAVGNKINAIGNKYSIDSEGISDGLQNASAALKVAGNDLNETISLITATNKIYQNPEEGSNMLKVAAARLRGQVDVLKEMGEDAEGVSTDLTKIQQQIYELTDNKVNIFEDEENLKSTYQMMLEIGEVFNSLNDRQQADLLETMFGKQRASAGASLLLNYEELENIKSDSMNAANSMAEEYSKYMESAEAHITIFKEKLTEAYSTFMSGDLIKYTADIGSGLLDLVNSTDLLKHSMLAILALNIGKGVSSVGAAIASTVKQMNTLGSALQQVKSLPIDDDLRMNALQDLGEATKNLMEKNLKLLLSQKQLGDSDKITILSMHNLTDEESQLKLEKMGLITATNTQSAANVAEAATTTTLKGAMLSLKSSIVGVGTSIKAVFLSNPIGVALTVITTAVSIATAAMNKYNEKLERQQEKLEDALSAYEDVKSELDGINSELDENKKKISELESKPKLTYAEKGQLEELKQITEQLELQKEISEWQLGNKQKNAAVEAVAYVNTKYNLGDSNVKDVDALIPNVLAEDYRNFEAATNDNVTDAEYLAARYKAMLGKFEEIQKEKAELFNSDEIFPEDVAMAEYEIDTYRGFTEDLKVEINDMLSSLMEQKANIQDYYDTIKDTPYEDMSTDARNCYDAMRQIDASIQTLYYGLGNNRLNSEVIDGIFNTEGIEVTKEKLIEMAQAGTLTPMDIAGYENLADALLNSNLIADEGCGIFETFCNEFYALVEASDKAAGSMKNMSNSISITDTIDQLNTQLKPAFDSIQSAWEDIFTDDGFTLDNVDLSMLDSIKSKIDELNKDEELGLSIDYSSFENLATVLTDTSSTADDVHNAFNSLATDIVNSLNPSLSEISDESLQMVTTLLQSLGVQNAEEVIISSLGYSYQQYSAAKEECANASLDLQTATQEEINAFVDEQIEAGNLGQALAVLEFNKLLVNDTHIETQDDINRIFSLAQAAGIGAEALAKLAQFKTDLENETDPKTRQWIMKSINEYTKTLSQEIQNVQVDFTPDTSNMKSGSKSGGSSSKSEKDLWLEEYKRKLKELENMRDKGIINEREFFDQSEMLLNTYLKDSQAHIEKYGEEISDAEKQLHDDWNAAYDSDAENLKKWQEKKLINMAEYYQSMMNLQDEYYNSEALKLKNLADTMEAEYGRMSHVNLTRPSVDASAMHSAGYGTNLESSSVYAQSFGNETKQVVVTPILPDGTILSPETLAGYADKLLNGEKIDADIKLATFEGSDAVKQTQDYISGLEKMQSEYQSLKKTFAENPYGDFTEDQLKAIEELTKAIEEHKSQLSGELGDIKSAYDDLIEIRDTYNEHGKISVDQYQSLCDMGFEYLALLSDESGALSLDEDAFQRLTDAKIQQIQVDMALQAADLIKNIQTEEQAVRYLADAYDNAAASALGMAENMLYAAQANAQLMYGADSMQAQAAATIVKGYENSKLLAGNIDIKMQSGGGYKEDKEDKDKNKFLKTFDWIGTLLEKISDRTAKLVDKVDKFYNWQKKNSMINRAVKASDREIAQNERAYQAYMKKANSVGLGNSYVRKVQNGTLSIEDVTDEGLADKIDSYKEWFDKAQDCLDTIEDLYDQQRDLIRQKLDNVLDYYSDMDSYLSSITSKMESLISLNDEMGKRSSLTELVGQFAGMSDQLESATTKNVAGVTTTEGSLGDSKKVAEAVRHDRQELADSIQAEIDSLDVTKSGTYEKLLAKIAKTQADIKKYEDNGWDVKKKKKFGQLQAELKNYNDLKDELDQNATSDTIARYQKIYTEYQKLQDKLDKGQKLSGSQQNNYKKYKGQIEVLRNQGKSSLDELYKKLADAKGETGQQSESDRINSEIKSIQKDLEGTATYQKLVNDIKKAENDFADLEKTGYGNLSKSKQKTYKKLEKELKEHYEHKAALDKSATADNIAEFNKVYVEWRRLQDKLDGGKNLSQSQWEKYNSYMNQLKGYADDKADTISKLEDRLGAADNPGDKLEQIERTYEESAKGIYDSYQSQIDTIGNDVVSTKKYQTLLAKAQKLEQDKKTKGLSANDEEKLKKYNDELEALRKGGTAANVSQYMNIWEKWYNLKKKLDKDGALKGNDATNYDSYLAQLKAWDEEKQAQIDDLISLREDDLEALQKTYDENVSEAESEANDYYANLYSLAKQIAEYNLTTLQAQLEYLDAYISYYKELISLYDTFSGDKLTKLLTDLDEGALAGKEEAYQKYLGTLQDKYNATLSEMNEYSQLLDALDTNDFGASMDLFDKALESYKAGGDTAMADKLQSVLDLLNERAVDADNWGEFADQWAEEWEKEFTDAKQGLIGTAAEIQNVNDALRQIRLDNISDIINELDTAKGILSSIADLIQEDWLYDGGELSEYGRAKAALLVSQLEDSQKKANAYLDLINEIQNSKDTYASDKAYMEDLNNATQNYYNTLGETASLENSIVELMKKSSEEEVNSIKKIIEARKKALQGKKEYADYSKTLKNGQKEIDSIKAEIDALESLSGAMDAATKAKLAQLKADLAEKEESLQETKDDHTYNLQIDALDEFITSLEDMLGSSTKSVAEIMEEYQDAINDATDIYKASSDSINDTLSKLTAFYGGMGTNIDGSDLDLTPDGTDISASGNNASPVSVQVPSADNNDSETLTAILDDTDEINQTIKRNIALAAEIFEKYDLDQMNREYMVFDPQLFNLANTHLPSIVAAVQPIPEYINNRNVQQPVINIHYDNMINVEGSVDKSFSKEFEHGVDKIYNGVVNKLAGDFRQRGIIPHRTTLPTVR